MIIKYVFQVNEILYILTSKVKVVQNRLKSELCNLCPLRLWRSSALRLSDCGVETWLDKLEIYVLVYIYIQKLKNDCIKYVVFHYTR